MKKIALAAAITLAALPAFAQSVLVPADRYTSEYPATTGSVQMAPRLNPSAERPSLNPAADGNANLLNRPVPNYGNVSGGYLNAGTAR